MKGIIDSTLREGEQAAHVYFDLSEKLRIIDLLIKVGVDEIEVGIAVTNPEIKELVRHGTFLRIFLPFPFLFQTFI